MSHSYMVNGIYSFIFTVEAQRLHVHIDMLIYIQYIRILTLTGMFGAKEI